MYICTTPSKSADGFCRRRSHSTLELDRTCCCLQSQHGGTNNPHWQVEPVCVHLSTCTNACVAGPRAVQPNACGKACWPRAKPYPDTGPSASARRARSWATGQAQQTPNPVPYSTVLVTVPTTSTYYTVRTVATVCLALLSSTLPLYAQNLPADQPLHTNGPACTRSSARLCHVIWQMSD